MESIGFILFLLCLLIIALIAFPIWVMVKFSSISSELRATRAELASLRDKMNTAAPAPRTSADASNANEKPESSLLGARASCPRNESTELFAQPSRAEMPALPVAAPPLVPQPPPVPPPLLAPEPPPVPPQQQQQQSRPVARAFNLEVFLGTKFLSWAGGVAAFLALVFFLKYSIDHGWISPPVRAALGFLFGAGLIAGGLFAVRKKYDVVGHTLCACGILCLYGVTFACRALYQFPFFGVVPTFALMALITVAAFALAVRLDGKWVALLGIVGGFLTPVLLSTGVDNPLGLFGYIALLDIGLWAVALRKRWDFLVPLGALGTACLQIGWAATFLGYETDTTAAIVVCLVFNALFLAGYVIARRMRREERENLMHALSVAGLVAVSFCFALYLALWTVKARDPLMLLGFVFLADACALAVAALDRNARLQSWLPTLSGLAVFVILAAWTAGKVNADSPLFLWALAGYFVFALLHSAFPLVLSRVRGTRGNALQAFAPLGLLLVIVPVAQSAFVPFAVWPAVLLLDLLAIVLATLTRSIVGVAAAFVLTLTTAALWIFKVPAGLYAIPYVPLPLLFIVGGFAVLFFATSLWIGRKVGGASSPTLKTDGFNLILPAMSSLLPFVLVVMMVARLAVVDPTPIFGLTLLLIVLTLGLAKILKNEWLPACALGGIMAVCWIWVQQINKTAPIFDASSPTWQTVSKSTPAFAYVGLGWLIGFYAIFAMFPFVFRRDFLKTRGPWITAAASGVLFFPLVYLMIKTWWPNNVMGLVPAAFVVPALASLIAVLRLDASDNPRRLGRLALFGGAALLFITLIFPIQFSRQWITIGWALEGAALLWLYLRVPHRALPWAGAVLLGAAFVRLAFNPAVLSYHVRGDVPILNWYLYTYGIAAACMFAGAWFARRGTAHVLRSPLQKTLPVLGVILMFLLLNIEIADFFTAPGSYALALEFSGNLARDLAYTVAWSLFALALLAAGIWKKLPAARYAALALLAVVLLKLFFHDLASLDKLYRVAAFFGTAVILIFASFLYQKFIASRETPPKAKTD